MRKSPAAPASGRPAGGSHRGSAAGARKLARAAAPETADRVAIGVEPEGASSARIRETTPCPVQGGGGAGRAGGSKRRQKHRHPAAPRQGRSPSCGQWIQSRVMAADFPAGPGPASAAAPRRRPPRKEGLSSRARTAGRRLPPGRASSRLNGIPDNCTVIEQKQPESSTRSLCRQTRPLPQASWGEEKPERVLLAQAPAVPAASGAELHRCRWPAQSRLEGGHRRGMGRARRFKPLGGSFFQAQQSASSSASTS